jgi:glyoxylase-like metal-dependent hydrolase (beta-lactamase superfamily II)
MKAKIVLAFVVAACVKMAGAAAQGLPAPVAIGGGAYALVADLGPPTYANGGLNANLGFIVTPEGVVVLDTGPSVLAARSLHDAIRKVTQAPLRLVVNTNSQPNRWHGNAYFKSLGVPIVAHEEAIRLMRETGHLQFDASRALLKEKAEGSTSVVPTEATGAERTLNFGGVEIRLLHFGPAHTRGDLAVWLPQSGILFAGDLVYTERLLAVIPAGNSGGWIKAFDQAMRLAPKTIVPGHGAPTTVAKAISDTRDYLVFLRNAAKQKLDAGESVDNAVNQIDQSRFSHLANFADLSRRNAFQVYLELEFE